MMPSRTLEPLETVFHLGHRKYNIDQRSHWWQRVFFRCIYLPFVRFAFKRVGIPAMDEVEVDGKKMRFCWYEDGGVFMHEDEAKAACRDEFDRVKPLPFGRVLPKETAQISGHIYPRAGKPKRYAFPSYELVPIPRSMLAKITNELKDEMRLIHKALDT